MRTKSRFCLIILSIIILLSTVSAAERLPVVGGDNETWGDILNNYLLVVHDNGGYLKQSVVNTTTILDHTIQKVDINDSSVDSAIVLDASLIDDDISASAAINLSKIAGGNTIAQFLYNQTQSAVNTLQNTTFFYLYSNPYNFINGTYNASYASSVSYAYNQSQALLDLYGIYLYNQTASLSNYATISLLNSVNSTTNIQALLSGTSLSNFAYNQTQISINTAQNFTNSVIGNSYNHTAVLSSLYGQYWYNQTQAAVNLAQNFSSSSFASVSYINALVLGNLSTAQNFTSSQLTNAFSNNWSLISSTYNSSYHALIQFGYNQSTSATLGVGSVNSTHILDGSIIGTDISSTTNITVANINVTTGIDIGLETKTAECNTLSCTATATCSSGKYVLYGYGNSAGLLSGLSIGIATADCTVGATSCAVQETDLVVNLASVKIVCSKLR